MVRLSDLDPDFAQHLLGLPLPVFETTPWQPGPPLHEARVAIVSTAGLHRRGDSVFAPGASDYRIIPGDPAPTDLVMSHVSVNFDRSGFQQDVNVQTETSERINGTKERGWRTSRKAHRGHLRVY